MKTIRPCRRNHAANWSRLQELRRPVTNGMEDVELFLSEVVNKSMQALAETLITANALSEIKSFLGPQEFTLWCNEHIKAKTVSVDTLLKLYKLQQRWVESGKSERETAYKLLGVLMQPDLKQEDALPIKLNMSTSVKQLGDND
jgi:hypothetical protein